MIFRRTKTPPIAQSSAASPAAVADFDFGPLLDAFGQVLAAYSRSGFDLPGRPASRASADLEIWRQHALMGRPVANSRGGAVAERDFEAVARAFAEIRLTEKQLTESCLAGLRDALWTCVNRVHVAVQADAEADTATATQMKRVQQAIQGLDAGAMKDEVLQALTSIESISRIRREKQHESFTMLADRINVLANELEDARRESETDVLTGLGNRKRFDAAIERSMQLHAISRAPLSLLIMDLDGLKQINDTLGHPVGDSALTGFSACLSKVFLQESDVLCRIGGDEFIALLPGTKQDLAERLANRLVQNVAALEPLDEAQLLRIGVSVGFSQFQMGEGLAAWMARTDAALYEAKAEGKGRAIAG